MKMKVITGEIRGLGSSNVLDLETKETFISLHLAQNSVTAISTSGFWWFKKDDCRLKRSVCRCVYFGDKYVSCSTHFSSTAGSCTFLGCICGMKRKSNVYGRFPEHWIPFSPDQDFRRKDLVHWRRCKFLFNTLTPSNETVAFTWLQQVWQQSVKQ